MRLAVTTKRARKWLFAGFAAITLWRVGRVVALIALLTTGAGLYISIRPGEAGSPSANGEITLASHSPVYVGPEDPEAAEAPYDALSRNFIGIPAPGNESFLATHVARLPEMWEEDPEERVYDEMRMSIVGIPAPSNELLDVSHVYVSPEHLKRT